MDRHTRLLILAPVGFVVAVTGAGIIAAVGLYGAPGPEHPLGLVLFVAKWMAILAGIFAFFPWAFAAMFAAIFGFRSPAYWLAVGCGIGAAGYLWGGLPADGPDSYALAIHILAGLAAGLLFWLIGVRVGGLGNSRLAADNLE